MTHEESRSRRKQIAIAMQAPDADEAAVARQFAVSMKHVLDCCREHAVPARLTHEEKRRRRKEVANAMQAPDADMAAVATQFGISVKYVYACCQEHEVATPGRIRSRPGARPVNMFAVLKDLLAGEIMETCAIKHKVSRARIGQIAKLAREGGWTELTELAKKHRGLGARKGRERGAGKQASKR